MSLSHHHPQSSSSPTSSTCATAIANITSTSSSFASSSTSSTLVASSAHSLPLSDITSDDRDDATKLPFAYPRRQPTCIPPASRLENRALEDKTRSLRSLFAPLTSSDLFDNADFSNSTETTSEFDETSSAWFATSNSSPSLRSTTPNSNQLHSQLPATLDRQRSKKERLGGHRPSTPVSPSLRRIAAAAVAAAEARAPMRRTSSRGRCAISAVSSENTSAQSVLSSAQSSSRHAIGNVSVNSSDSSLQLAPSDRTRSLSPSPSGVVFAPRRQSGIIVDDPFLEDSRRQLAIPTGRVESLPKSVPTRIPRTRVFIQRSSSGRDMRPGKRASLNTAVTVRENNTLVRATEESRPHTIDITELPLKREQLLEQQPQVQRPRQKDPPVRESQPQERSHHEPQTQESPRQEPPRQEPPRQEPSRQEPSIEKPLIRVSSVTVDSATYSEDIQESPPEDSADVSEFSDDAGSRFLSFRTIKNAVQGFRNSPNNREHETSRHADKGPAAFQSTSPRKVDEYNPSKGFGMPRPHSNVSGVCKREDTIPNVMKFASHRHTDRPRWNRMMSSGKIRTKGSPSFGNIGKAAMRLLRSGKSHSREYATSVVKEQHMFSDSAQSTAVVATEDKPLGFSSKPPTPQKTLQPSDMYIEFMKGTAEREARAQLSNSGFSAKVMARAHLIVKGKKSSHSPSPPMYSDLKDQDRMATPALVLR